MQNVGESTGSIFKILGSGKQIMKKKKTFGQKITKIISLA